MKYLIIALSALLLLSIALGVGYRDAFEFGVQIVEGFSNSIDTIKYVFNPESFKATLYNNQNGGSYTDNNGNVVDPYLEVVVRVANNSTKQIEQVYGKMWSVSMPTLIPSQYTESDFVRLTLRFDGKSHDVFYAPNGFTYYGTRYEVIVSYGGRQYLYKQATDFRDGTGGLNAGTGRVGFISPREQTTTLREWFINNYLKETTT
jgi:hypothetical protein